jgi:hypothetical protein
MHRSSVEQNKEGDGFVRFRWEEAKEQNAIDDARLTIRIGAEFPLGITDGRSLPIIDQEELSWYESAENRPSPGACASACDGAMVASRRIWASYGSLGIRSLLAESEPSSGH